MEPLNEKEMKYIGKTKKVKTNGLWTLVLLILCFSTFSLRGQDTPEEIAERFLELYKTSHRDAIIYLAETNRELTETKKEQYVAMVNGLDSFVAQVGKYHGHDLITEKNWGTQMKYMGYMLKYELTVVRIGLYFTKTKEKWKVYTVTIDTDELEEAMSVEGKTHRPSDDDAPKELEMVITEFFENYDQSGKQAFNFIAKKETGNGYRELEDFETLRTEFEELRKVTGEVKGFEIVKYVSVAESYSFVSCLVYFQGESAQFDFAMYKPNKKWNINRFKCNIYVIEQLEETVKFDFLN